MTPYPKQPVIDSHNPCYCPSLPARAYIHGLHQETTANSFSHRSLRPINPFIRVLAQAVNTPGIEPGDKGVQDSDSDNSGSSFSSDTSTTINSSHSSSDESTSGNEQFHSAVSNHHHHTLATTATTTTTTTTDTNNISFDSTHLTRFNAIRDSRLLARPPRKRKEQHNSDSDSEESDIRGPSKHARSIPGTLEKSFEVRLKRESLDFNLPSSRHLEPTRISSSYLPPTVDNRTLAQANNLLPRPAKPTEVEKFLDEIKQVIPGKRIPSDLTKIQSIAGYLGENGMLTAPLMKIIGKFRGIRKLSLSQSLQEYNGLNLGRVQELLPELHAPGLFTGLVSLNCDRVPLRDDDVLHFHNFSLRDLSLCATGISNTAVFLLCSHRRTLLRLSIGANSISDDAIVALITFEQLKHLNIDATEISMEGLRRYAKAICSDKRVIRVEVPNHCQKELDGISDHYLIDINPPLINEPHSVRQLSLVELRNNLAAHQTKINRIMITGNKTELRERLENLLWRRKDDLLVKEMLEKGKTIQVMVDVVDNGEDVAAGSLSEDEYD